MTQERERFFQAGGSALSQGEAAAKRFRLIHQLAAQNSAPWMCRQLGVARSCLYAWRQRQEAPEKRVAENACLTTEIESVIQDHRGF